MKIIGLRGRVIVVKLPHAKDARVDKEKIFGYLLSTVHPDGAPKSAFFMRFGFSIENWTEFASALREHGVNNEVRKSVESQYGIRYIVDGEIRTPDGKNPVIRTVWILEKGMQVPRLITAHPV